MTVAWYDSEAFDAHEMGAGHPERPDRLKAVRDHLADRGLERRLTRVAARPAAVADLAAVHDPLYVKMLEQYCAKGGGALDGDTRAGPASWAAATRAAGAVVEAVGGVLAGEYSRAFCSVRPPGHHARPTQAMGFCLFDNVAVAADWARREGGVERVAILDWDAHHGNGTQEIFYDRADVLFVSWHQYPFYPGTGGPDETGSGAGAGATLNCPLAAGAGDAALLAAWDDAVRPKLEAFRPELILISAGFDADRRDPLAALEVTAGGFEALSAKVVGWADEHCGGRVVSVLEGGYDLGALAEDVGVHLETML